MSAVGLGRMARLWPHLLVVAAMAAGAGMLFLREPGLGDDLDYWSLAFQLHEQGLAAWSSGRFHDLRWPVWGVSWLIQAIAGPGLLSFHGVPLVYLAAGAMAAFVLARRLGAALAVAWLCALLFVFHPLLDSVCFRPMPDLSEGVWGTAVILGWWATMDAAHRARMAGWAALTGLLLVTLESNRVTGAFMVPVLIVTTLALERRKFGRLLLIGLFAAIFYAALSALYHARTGDWWHDLHANLGNKDAKGIESPPVWMLPFRFLDSLWDGGPLAPAYCVLAALGIWQAWQHCGRGGRIVVLWFALLLLTYSCAPQRLWPYKPMLRDADRFLAALAVPMSVLAGLGVGALVQPLARSRWPGAAALARHPAIGVVACAALLLAGTAREFFNFKTIAEMRSHVGAKRTGTTVLSHPKMRDYVHLVAPREARRMQWVIAGELLQRQHHIEELAPRCEELWYSHHLMWVHQRTQLEGRRLRTQPPLPEHFAALSRDWRLDRVIAKGDNPDFVFFSRRNPAAPPPLTVEANDPAWHGLIPPLPARWERGQSRKLRVSWPVPPEWRGRLLHCEVQAASPQVEPCEVRLVFNSDTARKSETEYRLNPYVYPEPGRDFFAFQIPSDAEKCALTMTFERDTEFVEFSGFRTTVEPASALAH